MTNYVVRPDAESTNTQFDAYAVAADLREDDARLFALLADVRKREQSNVLGLLSRGTREFFLGLSLIDERASAAASHVGLTLLGEEVAQLCKSRVTASFELLSPDEFKRRMLGQSGTSR